MVVIRAKILNDEATGVPIFMLHTLPLDGTYLQTSLERIPAKHPIHLLDLPSHGTSEDVIHEELSFEAMARDIEEYRKSLSLGKIGIYGHGIGGFIAMHYAIKYNKHISWLIVSNTAINSGYRERMAWNIRSKFSNTTKDQFDRYFGSMDPKSLKMRFTKSFAAHFHPISLERSEQLIENCHRLATEPYVIISYYHIPNYNLRGKARRIKQPTLIIGGAYDVWPVDDIKKIKTEIKQGKLHFFPSGHFPMLDLPDDYWNTVFSWLSDLN